VYNDEKENLPNAVDGPENLCTKNKLGAKIEFNDVKKFESGSNGCSEEIVNNGKVSDSPEIERASINDKNNNSSNESIKKIHEDIQDRFILSLKDIRHLNRSYRSHHQQSYPHHPQHHFSELMSHLPLSPSAPVFHNNIGSLNFHTSHQQLQQHQENNHNFREREREREQGRDYNHRDKDAKRIHEHNMKIENDGSDEDSPSVDQMDLTIPNHSPFSSRVNSSAAMAAVAALEREHKQKSKDFLLGSNLNFPPPFQQSEQSLSNRHSHPSSPLTFPSLPNVSSLALTPPHSEYFGNFSLCYLRDVRLLIRAIV
jgi:hypothetical protein